VAELFADVRADTRRVVEQQLRKVTALSAREYQSFRPLELATTVLASDAKDRSDGRTTVRAEARSRRVLLVGLGVVALLGVGLVAWSRGSDEPAPKPAEPAVVPAKTAPQTISLKLSSKPDTAQIFVDDRLVPGNPATLGVTADGSRHTVRVEAPGFAVRREEVVYDRNQTLLLTLEELPRAPSAAPAPAKPKPAHVTQKKPKCDPPYVIDARGVKRFKPECL
jgi:serine/threonine-protein kinase